MKTRQEMVYDFMLSLSTNAVVFTNWEECDFEIGGYADHVKALAEEFADAYLQENT
jgi:viroplasmin and RNaseH domain-containing protein